VTGAGAGAGVAGGSGSTDLMTAALQRLMSGGAAR